MTHPVALVFALLYFLSDSTTVPLAAAKFRGPRDALKKGLQKVSFLSFLKRDDIIMNPAKTKIDLSLMHQGRESSSNRATRGRIVTKAKRIERFYCRFIFLTCWDWMVFLLLLHSAFKALIWCTAPRFFFDIFSISCHRKYIK